MALIGYARVSTDEQDTAIQLSALRAEGCTVILEDKASGGSRDRRTSRVRSHASGMAIRCWWFGSTVWHDRFRICSRSWRP
jgi:hypothetical protein